MSEILSREEFEAAKKCAEFRAEQIASIPGATELFQNTGGGEGVPEWIPTIEALAEALKVQRDAMNEASQVDWDQAALQDALQTLRSKGWIE